MPFSNRQGPFAGTAGRPLTGMPGRPPRSGLVGLSQPGLLSGGAQPLAGKIPQMQMPRAASPGQPQIQRPAATPPAPVQAGQVPTQQTLPGMQVPQAAGMAAPQASAGMGQSPEYRAMINLLQTMYGA